MFWITLPSILTVMKTCGTCVIIIALVSSALVLAFLIISYAIGMIKAIWGDYIK